MPRVPRQAGSSQIYHVILRGIDKRSIFLSLEDYQKFLYNILIAKEKSDFSVYAFCLMTNHVHMLVKCGEASIGDIIRRITVSYVQYHNNKYARIDHLFQNRFKSESVEYNVKTKYTDEELYRLINEIFNISKLHIIDINSRNIEI